MLESYSRVLESMAFNIVARIDDLLYVDDLTKQSERFALVPTTTTTTTVKVVSQQKKVTRPHAVSVSGTVTPHKAAFSRPSFSPASVPLISPARGERTPFLHNNSIKPHRRGFAVRRVLSNYLGVETKTTKICSNSTEVKCSNPSSKKTEQQREKKPCTLKNKTK